MKPCIALIYYVNLDHYSISEGNKEWLIKGGFESLVKAIKVPVNLCLTGVSLGELQKANPLLFKKINKLPNIKFFYSTYSHFIASDFPKDVNIQIDYGQKYLNDHVPFRVRMPIFAFPEYDLTQSAIKLIRKEYNFIFTSSVVINHGPLDTCEVFYKLQNSKQNLLCIHKDLEYRDYYHKYLREECSASDVVSAMRKDFDRLSQKIVLPCAVDFEAPVLNCVNFPNGETSPPRLDLFRKLHRYYSTQKINFVFLDCVTLFNKCVTAMDDLHNLQVSVKMNSRYQKNIIKKLSVHKKYLLKTNPQLYMECITSDFYTSPQKKIEFPATFKKKKGIVVIARSGLKFTFLRKKLKMAGV